MFHMRRKSPGPTDVLQVCPTTALYAVFPSWSLPGKTCFFLSNFPFLSVFNIMMDVSIMWGVGRPIGVFPVTRNNRPTNLLQCGSGELFIFTSWQRLPRWMRSPVSPDLPTQSISLAGWFSGVFSRWTSRFVQMWVRSYPPTTEWRLCRVAPQYPPTRMDRRVIMLYLDQPIRSSIVFILLAIFWTKSGVNYNWTCAEQKRPDNEMASLWKLLQRST
jgi:hypothetical protein